jgi:hypothetical protein
LGVSNRLVNNVLKGGLHKDEGDVEQVNGCEAKTATFLTSQKRSILKLQKKADFYRIPKAKIGRSFETLIMG